jgi:hypothetical protein
MRGLNLAVLIVGLTLIGAALYGFAGMDGSLKLAAAHTQPAPQSVMEIGTPPTGPCLHHHSSAPGV